MEGGDRRRFRPARVSAQLARFVFALPASCNVLCHAFDLPVCASVRRSSRPGCGGVSGLHQSQRLRHGQLVSPSVCPLPAYSHFSVSFELSEPIEIVPVSHECQYAISSFFLVDLKIL